MARLAELEALRRYAPGLEEAEFYDSQIQIEKNSIPVSVADGAEEYIPDIDIHEIGRRVLHLRLEGPSLSIWIDGKLAVEQLPVALENEGTVGLGSRWGDSGWSQRNLADDVYDGVFEKLSITTLPDEKGNRQILWSDCLDGKKAFIKQAKQIWDGVINWFIKYL